MEKDLFIKVLQNYVSTTVDEAQELHSLKEEFPYSQLLHVLSAKASQEHGFSHQQNELQLAAVYSADRGILKVIMSGHSLSNGSTAATVAPHALEQILKQPHAELEIGQGQLDLAETVIKDLKELYESRHNFEVMFADTVLYPDDEKDPGKSKKERIIELSKALNAPRDAESEEKPPIKRKREPRKDIIDELITTKTRIEPESEKQKEQIEIIDHFIKAQPSISNAKDKSGNITEGDLNTIKTGEFNDNIVSETLVELLLKQGKKDKAVEVLKKLIWKFPQKKAYFAAQIEELKK